MPLQSRFITVAQLGYGCLEFEKSIFGCVKQFTEDKHLAELTKSNLGPSPKAMANKNTCRDTRRISQLWRRVLTLLTLEYWTLDQNMKTILFSCKKPAG